MRRKDRQITDPAEIGRMLEAAQVCHLGLMDPESGLAYLVPLNFGYVFDEKGLHLYFHSAPQGKKLGLIDSQGRASFAISWQGRLLPADTACGYSTEFFCVMGWGAVARVTDPGEKRRGMDLLMRHCDPEAPLVYDQRALERTAVLRLDAKEYTAKGQLLEGGR